MGDKYNHTLFTSLVMKAMNGRTQKEFAEESGISPFNLNRLLKSNERVPQKGTLRKIAEASKGLVTETQLLNACGYMVTDKETPEVRASMSYDDCVKLAARLKDSLIKASGTARKYASVGSFLRDLTLTQNIRHVAIEVSQEQPYNGTGRLYAEYYMHCRISWLFNNYKERFTLPLIVYYCKTTMSGCIISECAFDMDTLMSNQNPDAFRFLQEKAKLGDVNYADYDMVTLAREEHSKEARLLHAIFGDDEDDEQEEGDK